MSDQIQISANDLGQLALADFCPRCFWIRLRLRNRIPFQIVPEILSSINHYAKRLVHQWFDKHDSSPPWMRSLGDLIDYKEPPPPSKFQFFHPSTNILLTGSPGGVFILRDLSRLIVDYRMEKYTGTQDQFYQMYMVQLNAYAFIEENLNLKPVSGLALIYLEPIIDEEAADQDENLLPDGFNLTFRANIKPVPLAPNMIGFLLNQVLNIHARPTPPEGRAGCLDCQYLESLVKLVSK